MEKMGTLMSYHRRRLNLNSESASLSWEIPDFVSWAKNGTPGKICLGPVDYINGHCFRYLYVSSLQVHSNKKYYVLIKMTKF